MLLRNSQNISYVKKSISKNKKRMLLKTHVSVVTVSTLQFKARVFGQFIVTNDTGIFFLLKDLVRLHPRLGGGADRRGAVLGG